MLNKPEIDEVHGFLCRRNALIVHFSGAPKGAGFDDHLFPDDLRHAMTERSAALGGLACSVVQPGDIFSGTQERNALGSIGIVIDLTSKCSLVAVSPHDCGPIVEDGKRRVPDEKAITVEDLEWSLSARIGHNEWVIRDCLILGVFAIWPWEVWTSQQLPHLPDMPDYFQEGSLVEGIRQVTLHELKKAFSRKTIFTFQNQEVCRLVPPPPSPIAHSCIYRTT